MSVRSDVRFTTRQYEDRDERAVLELLDSTLGGGPAGTRPPEFFRWKHMDNPFGRSLMLVAESDGRIIGLRAFMRWRFRSHGRPVKAVTAVDTATHPDFQGMGVFSSLTRSALALLEGDVALVYNTPNEKSLPGYLKMGWSQVGRVHGHVAVKHPLRVAARFRELDASPSGGPDLPVLALSAADVLRRHGSAVDRLVGGSTGRRFETDRSADYLMWRYGLIPLLRYYGIALRRRGRLEGLAIFRLRRRGRLQEVAVTECLVERGNHRAAGELLRRVRRSCDADHLTCRFPPGSEGARAALLAGFVRGPVAVTFTIRELVAGLQPDPSRMDSWALTLGDLEVF